jgi:exopolyphosphatase/guanosine-5'-triphosphate,3'-diphosphate pyrophosphatase
MRLDGLKEDRRAVIGGGLSVLRAVFDLLGIEEMQAAQGALRHGVLYDLLDREQGSTDIRSATVQRLATKFDVDAAQAQRVGKVATSLLRGLRCGRCLPDRAGTRAAQAALGGTAARNRQPDLAQRLPQARRLHPGQRRRARLCPARAAPAEPAGAGHRGKLRKLEADFETWIFVHQLMACAWP